MDQSAALLSLLPILILLIISLVRGVKSGVYAGLAVTSILFFVWDSPLLAFPAALVAAWVDTLTILMIVFGALLLHQSMEQVGYLDSIKRSLKEVHEHSGFQFYFLAFFMTAFFESVAGFGTPGAIVPILLMSLGYPAVLSISVVLLIDGLMAVSGAVGTPVSAGLEGPLDISGPSVNRIYSYAAGMMIVSGLIILGFIHRGFDRIQRGSGLYGLILYCCWAIPFFIGSFFLKEMTGLVAALTMGSLAYFLLFTRRSIDWKPWLPYGLLILILLLPKLWPAWAELLAKPIVFTGIFNTSVNAELQPLRSPLFPFILASLAAAYFGKQPKIHLSPVFRKTTAVFLVLFPSLAITRLMIESGSDEPSMVESMSLWFAGSGEAYPLLSPFMGVMGTFITGSTTVSNIIFGPVQASAAQSLSLSQELILALQLNGASLGNAVCLFNIIAAAAVAGIDEYTAILKKNILPVLAATLVTALCGYALLGVGP